MNRVILIGFLTVLLAIRFLIMPIFDWQTETVERLAIDEKRLDKLETSGENLPLLQGQFQLIQKVSDGLDEIVHTLSSEQQFKLEQQQKLENLLEQYNLSSLRFGWSESISLSEQGADMYRAQIQLKGKLSDFIPLHLELESNSPVIQVSGLEVRLDRQTRTQLGTATIDLELSFYTLGESI